MFTNLHLANLYIYGRFHIVGELVCTFVGVFFSFVGLSGAMYLYVERTNRKIWRPTNVRPNDTL